MESQWQWLPSGNERHIVIPNTRLGDKLAAEFSRKLDIAVDDCRVFKHNAGKQIPNINYNFKQDLLQEIDVELLKTINMAPHERVLDVRLIPFRKNVCTTRL